MIPRICFVIPIFGFATLYLYSLTRLAPEHMQLEFPHTLAELKALAIVLREYYKQHWSYVLLLFSSAYLYKQAFIIPGSVLLNVLAGALFGVYRGFVLCCTLTTIGASFCYWMSYWFGRDLLYKFFPDRLDALSAKVQRNSHQLIYYLLFLRMFPMSPNWLINVSSPIIGIPYRLFALTIFIGLMPYNFICVQTGELLASLESLSDIITLQTFLKMALLASVMLGPSFLIRAPVEE